MCYKPYSQYDSYKELMFHERKLNTGKVANNISDNKDNSFFSLVAEIKKLKSNECVVVKYDKKYKKCD